MSKDIKAFPNHGTMGEVVEQGMTLRDYFAAKAMTDFILSSHQNGYKNPNQYQLEQNAKNAYKMADAMLEARSK